MISVYHATENKQVHTPRRHAVYTQEPIKLREIGTIAIRLIKLFYLSFNSLKEKNRIRLSPLAPRLIFTKWKIESHVKF